MAIEKEQKKPAGPADYLANERTFLAWIRTSIALMGFGFVIVKFAVFIRQVALLSGQDVMVPQNRYSAMVGFVMVILGAITTLLAYLRFRTIQKQLQQNEFFPSAWLTIAVTAALVAGSVLLVLYLLPNL
jgi:putative membrane protein